MEWHNLRTTSSGFVFFPRIFAMFRLRTGSMADPIPSAKIFLLGIGASFTFSVALGSCGAETGQPVVLRRAINENGEKILPLQLCFCQ